MSKQNSYENLSDKYKEPEIRLIDQHTDLTKLKLEKLGWDATAHGVSKDLYRIQGYAHATGGYRGVYDIWACPRNSKPTVDNLIAWSGSYGVRWGFNINPQNYCKYKWANTSFNTNIRVVITRNDLIFDEFFAYDMLYAISKVTSKVLQYQEFCVDLNCQDFENEFINRKVFWRDQPATIISYVSEQACVMLKPESKSFTKSAYFDEEDYFDEDQEVKCEILSEHIWWFRN